MLLTRFALVIAGATAFAVAATSARAAAYTVDATDSIFIGAAGQLPTIGSSGSPNASYPAAVQPPVEIATSPGANVTITATGAIAPQPGPTNGPSGTTNYISNLGAFGIIGPVIAGTGGFPAGRAFFLVGAFIGTGTSPGEYTPFYVGDGGTFTAPAGTTELLLGLADGYAFAGTPSYYGDNSGSLSVSVGIAEPVSLALLAPWLAGIAVLRRHEQGGSGRQG